MKRAKSKAYYQQPDELPWSFLPQTNETSSPGEETSDSEVKEGQNGIKLCTSYPKLLVGVAVGLTVTQAL